MHRRKFIQNTLGTTIITPLLNTISVDFIPTDIELPSLIPMPVSNGGKWFPDQPTRIGWFTLRFTDAQNNAAEFVRNAAAAKINLLCLTMGGSFAFYPSSIPYHEWAPGIDEQHDFLKELVSECSLHPIKLAARFDFSKQSQKWVAADPQSFFTLKDGSHPVDASGRTPPCINGDFFKKTALSIMEEVVSKYKPSLVYLNNFGNNLGGQNLDEPCQCINCKNLYSKLTGQRLPTQMNENVRNFLKQSAFITGKLFYEKLKSISPQTILINADTNPSEGWHSESRMVIAPSMLWAYTTSEAVNRQRTTYPASVTCNNITSYSSNSSRLALMPANEVRLRLRQALAHGSPPTYVATGTMTDANAAEFTAMKEVFTWHAANEDLFTTRFNPAKVAIVTAPEHSPRGRNLITQQSMRGIYRILTENHIPVVVSEITGSDRSNFSGYDLVVVCPGAKINLESFVANGGRAIFVGEEPAFAIPQKVKTHVLKNVAYAEVRDVTIIPFLKGAKYLMTTSVCPYTIIDIFSKAEVPEQTFVEYPAEKNAALTFVPPMIENPAEVSQSDLKHSEIPACLFRDHGKGKIIYLPWDLGALYDRLGMEAHSDLFCDLVDRLLPFGRQIKTDANSSVEIILSALPDKKKIVVYLINGSGQTQNNYNDAIPMNDLNITINGTFSSAVARTLNQRLTVKVKNNQTTFILPHLNEFEAIVLEK